MTSFPTVKIVGVESAPTLTETDFLLAAKPLIITGAPYSGASILAKGLQRAGWFPGDRLCSFPQTDAAGGVQDEDVSYLHKKTLLDRGVDVTDPSSFDRSDSVKSDWKAGRQLLHRKFHDKSVWGWKDSRATLLLKHWDKLLPSARWLFAVRPPALFAWSLLCRGLAGKKSTYPITQARAALALWTAYNARIWKFAQERPDRCSLLIVPDEITNSQYDLNEVLQDRWGYGLQAVDLQSIFIPQLIKKQAPRWVEALAQAYLPARKIFGQMQDFVGRSSPPRSVDRVQTPSTVRPNICLTITHPFRFSETFVYAHATRLPANVALLTTHSGPTTEDGLPLITRLERIADKVAGEFYEVDRMEGASRAIARYFRREKFAAVLAEFGVNGLGVMKACQLAGIPLVVHFHGYDVYERSPKTRKHHEAYPKLFEAAAAIVGVSHDMIDRLAEMGAPRQKLFYNPCGVDTSEFTGADPANCPPTFLAVGRMVAKKAPHLSVLAFKQLLERVPEARLVMVGGGELLEIVNQIVKALGIGQSVEIVNARSHFEVALAMRKARAFIQHSVQTGDGNSEGTPVSVLEAGSSGLPVVATRHAGIADVVLHGETGYLVDEFDIGAMAEAMQTLAENPTLAGTLGKRAREHICANHSMEKSIARLWSVIEGVLPKQ